MTVYLNSSFRVSPTAIRIVVERITDDLLTPEPVARLLRPLLAKRGCTLARMTPIDTSNCSAIQVEIATPTRGRTIGDGRKIGTDVERLLDAAFATGPLRPATVGELLRTGHHGVLMGQPETDWLDVKDRPYQLEEHGRFKLACDIAAFANADGGTYRDRTANRKRARPGHHQQSPTDPARRRDRRQALRSRARLDLPAPDRRALRSRGHAARSRPRPARDRDPRAARGAQAVLRPPRAQDACEPSISRSPSATVPTPPHWDLAELHSLIIAGRAALAQTSPDTASDGEQPK